MASKYIIAFFAQVALAQIISAQCGCGSNLGNIGNIGSIGLGSSAAYSGSSCGNIGVAAPIVSAPIQSSYGGGLAVSSSSPLSPSGIAVQSNNALEGNLQVVGSLPFLAAVALEGALASAGSGNVAYSCGDQVAITSEQGYAGNSNLGRGYAGNGFTGVSGCGARQVVSAPSVGCGSGIGAGLGYGSGRLGY